MRSASSRHAKGRTPKRAGRHRAPSRYPRTVKIITAGGLAVALIGAFAVYQAQSQQPGYMTGGPAAYRRPTLPLGDNMADGMAAEPKQKTKAKSARPFTTTGQIHAPGATRRRSTSKQPLRSSASSTAKLRSAVQNDIANGNYLLAVAQYLIENGYSRAAAAGVASCVDGESGGNPESIGSGGGGLIGWTPISSAQPNSNIITGHAAPDMMTQLADILYYNSSEIGQSLVAQLNSISDPVSAADFFSLNFEKPAVTYSDVVPSVADQIFSELAGL